MIHLASRSERRDESRFSRRCLHRKRRIIEAQEQDSDGLSSFCDRLGK
jgi:hypothetical protein